MRGQPITSYNVIYISFILAFVLLNLCLHTIEQQTSQRYRKPVEVQSFGEIEYLFLGSSITAAGINASLIDGAYNYGVGQMGLEESVGVLKDLKRQGVLPHTIILEVNVLLESDYMASELGHPPRPLPIIRWKGIVKSMFNPTVFDSSGFNPLRFSRTQEFLRESAIQTYELYFIEHSLDSETAMFHLNWIELFAEQHHIELIKVYYPECEGLRNLTSPSLPYDLGFGSFFPEGGDYFADCVHLNQRGANTLTEYLKGRL